MSLSTLIGSDIRAPLPEGSIPLRQPPGYPSHLDMIYVTYITIETGDSCHHWRTRSSIDVDATDAIFLTSAMRSTSS